MDSIISVAWKELVTSIRFSVERKECNRSAFSHGSGVLSAF